MSSYAGFGSCFSNGFIQFQQTNYAPVKAQNGAPVRKALGEITNGHISNNNMNYAQYSNKPIENMYIPPNQPSYNGVSVAFQNQNCWDEDPPIYSSQNELDETEWPDFF